MSETGGPYGAIPPVHQLLRAVADLGVPRALRTFIIRRELDAVRAAAGGGRTVPAPAAIVARVRGAVARLADARLRPVINATGVLLHTNLGRAPLGAELEAVIRAAAGYGNLELDLERGERGGRAAYVEQALAALCAAEAAVVVNNCAAALLLTMAAVAAAPDRREVIVSRGELIQIGGGFRIPEILAAAGVRLHEVGTTNRTTAADYAAAAGPHTAAVLTVHRSNFTMQGFVASPPLGRLAAVAAAAGVPLVADLGSGAVTPTDEVAGLPREPAPQEVLAAGATLVCFSGDKLFGGPQAGIAAGSAAWVTRLRRHPLFRALRPDKVALALLQRTVDLQLEAPAEIPLQRLLRVPAPVLRERAQALAADLPAELQPAVVDCTSRLGGGTLPGAEVPSAAVALQPAPGTGGADPLAAALRRGVPPVVGYIHRGRVQLDLRTVFPEQDALLAAAVRAAVRAAARP